MKSGSTISPGLFFLKISLPVRGLFWFHINFRMICSASVKNSIKMLTGNTLNLYIGLGSMNILTILILPTHEHLFVSSSISFLNVLYFSVYRSFTFLVKFIPRYFILFDVTLNGIVFWQFVSLIVHYFCIEMQKIFVYWFCILQHCWICL